jgi:hypothetical protein
MRRDHQTPIASESHLGPTAAGGALGGSRRDLKSEILGQETREAPPKCRRSNGPLDMVLDAVPQRPLTHRPI